ncbi:GNAT family N-acetyltransferase [Peribacillus acanthi]|uniref:GNAT family N-acetyltransferase n=1 Tax=Peribacillus acanthi TaxID=2171554 RepID=UPI000D3E7F63|nr:GNAT family N-acetyltransferase [Peribacillus acanthi]
MNLQLRDVTKQNFFDIINLKSELEQEKKFQLFETMVGSNAFFIALASVEGWKNRAIYDGETLIGFGTYGLDSENNRYEMVSMMLGHQFQGKGYGVPAMQLILDDMVANLDNCNEIYLTVIPFNKAAIHLYKKLGFEPTGEIFKAHHDEHVYRLKVKQEA